MLLKYNRVLSIRDCPYAFFSTCPEWQAIFAFAPPLSSVTFVLLSGCQWEDLKRALGSNTSHREPLGNYLGCQELANRWKLYCWKDRDVWGRTWNAGLRSDPLPMCSPARFVGPRKSLNIEVCRSSFIIQQKPAVYLSDLQFTAGSRATASSKEKKCLDMIFLWSSIWSS